MALLKTQIIHFIVIALFSVPLGCEQFDTTNDSIPRLSSKFATCDSVSEGDTATLSCPDGQTISRVDFASYGTAQGSCETGFTTGSCHASSSQSKVEDACLDKQSCTVKANNGVFGDPCGGVGKKLSIIHSCSGGTQNGLLGTYFDNMDFTEKVLERIDRVVNFDWGRNSPASSIDSNSFSVRWTGFVEPQFSETYTFYTISDDGVRLSVNNKQIINNWTNHGPTENKGTISLQAGTSYSIKMEYFENGGGAVAKLLWSSRSQGKESIPEANLSTEQSGDDNDDDDNDNDNDNDNSTSSCTEAMERESAKLSCASGEKITSIDFASYGLPAGSCDKGFDINNSCHAANSSSKVSSACLNKQSCTVAVSNGLFGNDPCPGTRKKLTVEYSCSGGEVEDLCPNDPNKMVPGECGCGKAEGTCDHVAMCTEAMERESAKLSCASGEKITSIDFASYGLPKGSCDNGFDINNSCHAANSSSKVTSACLNKQSCTVAVSNGLFSDDPCPGTRKKLAVEFSCSGGDDVEDLCPNDPNKMVPGECGCGVSEGSCDDSGDHMPVFLLAGQSNMEGNVSNDLFEELLNQLGSGSQETLQQRLEDSLTNWYKNDNDGYAMYGYSQQMVHFEASELIRLKSEGLVNQSIVNPHSEVWCALNDAIAGPLETNCGHPFGPELVLGHYLGNTPYSPTSLIKVAKGGSTQNVDWLSPTSAAQKNKPVGEWYTTLSQRIKSLHSDPASVHPECTHRDCQWGAFVWFQGENDSFDLENAENYQQNLANLIADVRSEIGSPSLPVIVVQIGAWPQSMSFGDVVAAAQETVVGADPYAELVVTDDLSGFYHFDPAAQLIIGERVAKAITAMTE